MEGIIRYRQNIYKIYTFIFIFYNLTIFINILILEALYVAY